MVAIRQVDKIARDSENIEEVLEKLHNLTTRQPKPPAPEGGISIRAAGKKYNLDSSTISRWVKRGYIAVLLRTKNELYVEEKSLAYAVALYKKAPGRGKSTLKHQLT